MPLNAIQVESCLNIANIQLSEEDLDIMLQSIGLDDDGTVCTDFYFSAKPAYFNIATPCLQIFVTRR
jgi:hypothetical protein